MAIAHLICGASGAGKTTYASALAARAHGVRLSLEDWMETLYGPDAKGVRIGPVAFEWLLDRRRRCEAEMWSTAEQVLAAGVDVVFDTGFPRRDDRDYSRQRARELGAEPKLHYLDVDRETRRARVLRQKTPGAPSLAFALSEEMFDFIERFFEPPSDDELYDAMIVCESPTPGSPTLF